jgi:hypothetical protein
MELIRVNDTEDPQVKSNVTLVCRFNKHDASPPEWSFQIQKNGHNETMRAINETNPPEGLMPRDS